MDQARAQRRAERRRVRRQQRENNRDSRRVISQHLVRSYYSSQLGENYMRTSLHRTYFAVEGSRVRDGTRLEEGPLEVTEFSAMNPTNLLRHDRMVQLGIKAILNGMPFRLASGYTSSEYETGDEKDERPPCSSSKIVIEVSDDSDNESVVSFDSDATVLYVDADGPSENILPEPEPESKEEKDIQCWQDEPEIPPLEEEEALGPSQLSSGLTESLGANLLQEASNNEHWLHAVSETEEEVEATQPLEVSPTQPFLDA